MNIDWILNNWQLCLEVVGIVVSVIMAIILSIKTRNVKYLKEVKEMIKFRTAGYREKEEPFAQSFPNTRPVYRLNKATGELEETDEVIDIDELVNSCKDTCLQACLERFIPKEEDSDDLTLYNDMVDDLDVMAQVAERAEEYREAFNLQGASIEEVFSYVGQHAEELKKKLEASDKIKNGGFEDETTEKGAENDETPEK